VTFLKEGDVIELKRGMHVATTLPYHCIYAEQPRHGI
jgi:hypothetical protein